jgi:hypothetical protein
MVILLISSVLIVGLVAIAIYLWQKPANNSETIQLPQPAQPRGLFSDIQPVPALSPPENNNHHDKELISRAANGDLDALIEAKGLDIYSDVLNEAVLHAWPDAKLLSLASHVSRNDLPVNRSLAEAMMRAFQNSPNREVTAKMLHFTALADDAELYGKAIEMCLGVKREGKLNDITATELLALFNGEFWLLSSPVRSSGTGFILKRTLSSARRELEGTTDN